MALEARDLVKSPNKESGIAAVTVITMVITVTMWNVVEENLSACKSRLFGRFKDQHTQRVSVGPAEREQRGSTHCR